MLFLICQNIDSLSIVIYVANPNHNDDYETAQVIYDSIILYLVVFVSTSLYYKSYVGNWLYLIKFDISKDYYLYLYKNTPLILRIKKSTKKNIIIFLNRLIKFIEKR